MDKVGDWLLFGRFAHLVLFYAPSQLSRHSTPYSKKAFSWEDEEFCCP